jgi:alpha-maltose-1-phosphate synthase
VRVCLLSNEYPPNVYGGAGVHVDYLSRSLARHCEVSVHCFGDQSSSEGNLKVTGHKPWKEMTYTDPRYGRAMEAFTTGLHMAADLGKVDIVHCHTWYTHLAGLMAQQLYQVPFVLTTHSFEPSRPWKVDQLGNAYHASAWVERTAIREADGVIAVSQGMKRDAVELFGIPAEKVGVIHNGIDLEEYRQRPEADALTKRGIDPAKPIVLFVGRITKQKGILYLARAIPEIRKDAQIVLCAGAADDPGIQAAMQEAVEAAKKSHPAVFWIEEMLPRNEAIQFYSHATVFCCPSIYEPFGIINLEAMACATAVVASHVGGIPEVVVPGETGTLVRFAATSATEPAPVDPVKFSHDLAAGINELLGNPERCKAFAAAGRARVEQLFSWDAIAKKTVDYYQACIEKRRRR